MMLPDSQHRHKPIRNMNTKVTLGRNYILRQSTPALHTLFNTVTSKEYTISRELFFVLKIFKNNLLSLSTVRSYLEKNHVSFNFDQFDKMLLDQSFAGLLEESEEPYTTSDMERLPGLPDFVQCSPSIVELLMSERCNLRCKHCYQDSGPLRDADFPEISRLLNLCDELEDINIEILKITGGEPLLFRHFNRLAEKLATKKYQKVILTNGLLIRDSLINIVKDKNFKFGISIDGGSKEIHEFTRGKNTFDKTVKNIKKLLDNGIRCSIATTIHKENIKDIQNIFDLAFQQIGVSALNINIMEPIGRGIYNNYLCLDDDEYKRLKDEIASQKKKYPGKKIEISDVKDLYDTEAAKGNKIYCAAGTSLMALSPSLHIYPCLYGIGKPEFSMGRAGDSKLMDIWGANAWSLFRGDIDLSDLPACSGCKFNMKCGARNCRLKPLSIGLNFYAPLPFCKRSEAIC